MKKHKLKTINLNDDERIEELFYPNMTEEEIEEARASLFLKSE